VSGGDGAQAEISADLRDALADRAQHLLLEASLPPAPTLAPSLTAAAAPVPAVSLEMVGRQALASIPQVECVSDFSRYLQESAIREPVIGRFQEQARPLL